VPTNALYDGPDTYRVLCTGSRRWTDVARIGQEIEIMARTIRAQNGSPLFVHGACPDGADLLVEKYCRTIGNYATERHPADWKAFPKLAGYKRNQDMVNLGADYCLAFCMFCEKPECRPNDHITHGTKDCIERAEFSKIPVIQVWDYNKQEGLF
jgi:hypothetical protein